MSLSRDRGQKENVCSWYWGHWWHLGWWKVKKKDGLRVSALESCWQIPGKVNMIAGSALFETNVPNWHQLLSSIAKGTTTQKNIYLGILNQERTLKVTGSQSFILWINQQSCICLSQTIAMSWSCVPHQARVSTPFLFSRSFLTKATLVNLLSLFLMVYLIF